jgi:hypothetical protein
MSRLSTLCVAAGIAALPIACALAGPAATLNATYDSFLDNTEFTLTNTSDTTETGVTLLTSLGPTFSVSIPDLLAGDSYTYSFGEQNGGFIVDPAGAGVDDGTQYAFSLVLGGLSQNSGWFSTASNLTGGYVDFLGNTCFGYGGCGVAQAGLVAAIPEPSTAGLLGLGLTGLFMARRRRAA